jgi:hypothetical protein
MRRGPYDTWPVRRPPCPLPFAHAAANRRSEEHHIGNFDDGAFFHVHDYNGDRVWDVGEILKTYGMEDPSARDVSEARKDALVDEIMHLMDTNANGVVEREEWDAFCAAGKTLPDFGLGPGHHWDMETEYEIHHWERYHDENTKREDLTHPEDIEHFRQHDELEDEEMRVMELDKMAIVEQNIPRMFRRD